MSSQNESLAHPLHAGTRLVIRGAVHHFSSPFSRSILVAAREKQLRHIVVATSMASQALHTYLGRFRTDADAQIEPLAVFQGDEDSFESAITGVQSPKTPSAQQLAQAYHRLAQVLKNMKAAPGRILVLCQLGRNRSFTTAFIYYICYHVSGGAAKTIAQALADFKKWPGVSYDPTLQCDGYQRLDESNPLLPWMQSLARIFHDPVTKKISKARIAMLLAA